MSPGSSMACWMRQASEPRPQHLAPIGAVPRRIHRFDEEHIRACLQGNLDLEGTVSGYPDPLSHDVDTGPWVGVATKCEPRDLDLRRRGLDSKRLKVSLESYRQSPGRGRHSLDLILDRRDVPGVGTDREPSPGERRGRYHLVERDLAGRRAFRGTDAISIRALDRCPAEGNARGEVEVGKGGPVRGLHESRRAGDGTRFLNLPSGAHTAELARTDADSAAVG